MEHAIAILGAGAAGMMAAATAAERLASLQSKTENRNSKMGERPGVAIFEKNVQPGIKVLVCGGGRCNFTNAGTVEELILQFGRNGRFLTPALRRLDNEGLRAWFRERGVESHVEHHGKIYPDSNRAKSVVDALVGEMRKHEVRIFTGAVGTVTGVARAADSEGFVLTTANGERHTAKIVLVAMGGMSYQRMGTTGDGYGIARGLGHGMVTPRPAIVGLLIEEGWTKELQGLAVPDVEARIAFSGTLPKLATGRPVPSVNDMLFTHFGLSGPAILNFSEIVAELLEKFPPPCAGVPIKVDFARHQSHEELHALMRGWQQRQGKKLLRTMLSHDRADVVIRATSPDQTAMEAESAGETAIMPRRLAEKFLELEGIGREQACSGLTSGQIHRLVERLKNTMFTVTGTRGFKEAMVTAGGIPLDEVDPKTMESKIVPGLFLSGEVLDSTGPSGGYNLQLAFSTGYLAGEGMAGKFG